MKKIVAIKSCHRDCGNGFNQAVRDTWLRAAPVDYKFFVGNGTSVLAPDEEPLKCGDAYMDLPNKTRAIFRWVLDHAYDHAFMCDTDTYVVMRKLATYDPSGYDLIGYFNGSIGVPRAVEGKYAWVSGGAGYWVSRRAMELIVSKEPSSWAEDLWVGQVVGEAVHRGELKALYDTKYGDDNEITSHFCSTGMKRTFDVRWLHQKHREKPQ